MGDLPELRCPLPGLPQLLDGGPAAGASVALAVNALAVFYVRNAPPPRVAPTLFARERVRDDLPEPKPGRRTRPRE